ncbi:MAG: hypothetical protein C0404_02725 [Verrucomicrobia bacterium]|nr:hypothetical protein [Verrucomicrobiota bacterium]
MLVKEHTMRAIAYAGIVSCLIFTPVQSAEVSQTNDKPTEVTAKTDNKEAEAFSQAVKKQQKNLPKKVNSYITWTDITLEGKSVINIYLVNPDDLNVPLSVALAELKTSGKANIVKGLKDNDGLKAVLRHGYSLVYRYYGKDKQVLHEFTVELKDLPPPNG